MISDPSSEPIVSTARAELLALKHFGIKATAKKLPGEFDLNYYLLAADGSAYILKIARPQEDPERINLQNQILLHLEHSAPDLPMPRVILNVQQQPTTSIEATDGPPRMMRLLSWLPGKLWAHQNPKNPNLLESLGQFCGQSCAALQGFDHPAAHQFHKWNNAQGSWIKTDLHFISDPAQLALVRHFLDLYETEVLPLQASLRHSVIHNDANDYNILVSQSQPPEVVGLIDFGDAIYAPIINDLAIAAAYALMDQPDPLATLFSLVRGFHKAFPLQEKEMALLFPLIALRLCISVTVSSRNAVEEPDNDYLLVSADQAWNLLKKLKTISPALAHYTIRHAGGIEPCPRKPAFQKWLEKNRGQFAPVINPNGEKIVSFDLSVGSLTLGNVDRFDEVEVYQHTIQNMLAEQGGTMGIGGYGEVRPFYSTDAYCVMGNNGPQWRTVHLGQDIWAPAGIKVYAPWEGKIHSFQNNDLHLDYGPTIILEHHTREGLPFYTLYGHLSNASLEGLEKGQTVAKGQLIATLGDASENGHWPPHLHFQTMLDLLDKAGDFPGVAFPETQEIWKSICPDWSWEAFDYPKPEKKLTHNTIAALRQKHLGKSLSLSYQKPLHIVRGYGQYLYDHTARRYLDTANNVPHVGHQHPRVVRAGQQQMAVLNTNTRYLHENMVQFAEELLATFPPSLSVCYFVNSGSEANELALRMARNYTRQKDMIVVEVGYHGNTGNCIEISSYKFDGPGGSGAADHIQVVPMPDTYRGVFSKGPEAGIAYARYIGEAIDKVNKKGRGIAGFICESILSCGGQIVLPEGYLQSAFEQVRKAGGLCIVDEVQTGFGRVGDHFWAFELQGVVPDIVTMGKPIGNGHPLAAVVTTREVADAFANGMEFFNTFGGNPVSCAIGREVLQVVKDEELQANAKEVGDYLQKGLCDLALRFPIIGDVRGHGLFLGVELVKDRETLEPAAVETSYLSNRMREQGILMGTDGPFHNVLKIKPPMCFNKANADFLLNTLEKVLGESFLNGGMGE